MYHWDTPLVLEDQGGWLSDQSPDWFEEYARVLYTEFGDRVGGRIH
jgi:beta-glucosidase/6-phospho-beta-glucosidase/beta-galactosidase